MSQVKVQPAPGGSLLVAWQVNEKHILIVGGGEVAAQRLLAVLNAGARVTLVAPSPLHANILPLLPLINYHDRAFTPSDLDALPNIVLTAISDPWESRNISSLCRERRIPINVADDPPACDFYFGSIIRRGPLQILVSTNGNGPKIANLLKKRIEDSLPENIAQVIDNVGMLRKKLRQRTKDAFEMGPKRMKWISQICDTWSFPDLASLNEDDLSRLLDEGWEQGVVPHPSHIIQYRKNRQNYSKLILGHILSWGPGFTFTVGFFSGIFATIAFGYIPWRRPS